MTTNLDGVLDKQPGSLQWPRVYLDSAILLDIADGRLDRGLLSRLLAAMTKRPKWLVVSRDHMQDVMSRTDAGNRDRFAAAVEQFPFRAVVHKEPHEIEPWTDGPRDIELRPVAAFRELLQEPAAAPYLAKLATAQEQLHVASSSAQAVRRTDPPLSPKGNKFVTRCLVTLARGWMGTDVPGILAMWEAEAEESLSDAERSSIISMLTPWAGLLSDYEREYSPSAEDRDKLLQNFRDSFDDASREHSPGMFLARRLSGCWHRNVHRKPRRSDSVDGMHASYFPYVDVATCDASAFSCLAPHIGAVSGIRRPILLKNGDLTALVEAVASLDLSM